MTKSMITRIDHDDPRSQAALKAEGRLFARYELDYQIHFVELKGFSPPGQPSLRVRVLEVGEGPPLVMVPGGSGDAWFFAPLMAELTTHLSKHMENAGLSHGKPQRPQFPLQIGRRLAAPYPPTNAVCVG